ncbi:MAG: glycerol-3-phosphate 1-O-acyltransferase PlsY [candidate division WOR-3 bacterium]
MHSLSPVISLFAGFAFGSIPSGYLAGRLKGIDIRKHGSGNIGFTNVQRVLGLGWAVPVLVLDLAKGIIPVLLAERFGLLPAMVGLGAICGHIFCPWLGFNGGKGVATTIGVTAVLCPRAFLPAIAVFLLVLLVSGFVSLSSISFAISLPFLTLLFYRFDRTLLIFTLLTGMLIIIRHIPNIRRLTAGTEPKFGLWLKLFRRRTE